VRTLEEVRRKDGIDPQKNPAQLPNGRRGRTVRRDGHEPLREKMYAKMQTAEAQGIYNRRMHIAETPFAIIKAILGVRRFLLRGLENVRTEWRWACTACNVKKLAGAMAAVRAERTKTRGWMENQVNQETWRADSCRPDALESRRLFRVSDNIGLGGKSTPKNPSDRRSGIPHHRYCRTLNPRAASPGGEGC